MQTSCDIMQTVPITDSNHTVLVRHQVMIIVCTVF